MAKSKYAHVIGKVPKEMPGGEPRFRDAVEARKRELVGVETALIGRVKPAALGLRYQAIRKQKELLSEQESALNVEQAALEELLQTVFEEEGLKSLQLEDGSTIAVSHEPQATVIDKEGLIAWAKENGYERMLTLYAQTVNSIAKEILAEGGEVAMGEAPDGTPILTVMGGTVKLTQRPKMSLRKS